MMLPSIRAMVGSGNLFMEINPAVHLLGAKAIALMGNCVYKLWTRRVVFNLATQSVHQRLEQMTVTVTYTVVRPYALNNRIGRDNASTVDDEHV